MNWYSRLIGTIEITGTGVVADNLRTVLKNGLFQKLPILKDLDSSVPKDLEQWFCNVFNPWFAKLSTSLEVDNSQEELTAESYTEHINKLITGLFVARSYYAYVAEQDYMTSLKNVSLYKTAICEEIANSLAFSFEQALKQYGSEIEGKSLETTVSSIYEGSTPERFIWKGNVLVNHVKYEDIKVMGQPQSTQQSNANCSGSKQYLPWVFCAAFGLIAWSAAAKESDSKQQRSTNK